MSSDEFSGPFADSDDPRHPNLPGMDEKTKRLVEESTGNGLCKL